VQRQVAVLAELADWTCSQGSAPICTTALGLQAVVLADPQPGAQ